MALTALEKDIQNNICEYLALRKHFFWRNNNTPIFDKKSGRHRSMPKFSKHGTPDIIVIHLGMFIGLEVKRENTKQSEHQKEFEQGCLKSGGQYYVVRSITDVQQIGL